jgi:hypothetical protein
MEPGGKVSQWSQPVEFGSDLSVLREMKKLAFIPLP